MLRCRPAPVDASAKRDEFTDLFAAAGFRLERVIETQTPIRLIEAVVAR